MNIPLTILVYAVALFVAGLEAIILYQIATDKMKLLYLISNDDGDASLSRFQFLIFTFVIGAGFLYLTVKGSTFPVVDEGVLMLLGISGASYALGKTLDKAVPPNVPESTTTVTVNPPQAPKE